MRGDPRITVQAGAVALCGILSFTGCYQDYLVRSDVPADVARVLSAKGEIERAHECLAAAQDDSAWQRCIVQADQRLAQRPELVTLRLQLRAWYRPPDMSIERQARLESLRVWSADSQSLPGCRLNGGSLGKPVFLRIPALARALPGKPQPLGPDTFLRLRLQGGGHYALIGGGLLGVSPVFLGLGAREFVPPSAPKTGTVASGTLLVSNPIQGGALLSIGVASVAIGTGFLLASLWIRPAETKRDGTRPPRCGMW